jgi:hypothetical protein
VQTAFISEEQIKTWVAMHIMDNEYQTLAADEIRFLKAKIQELQNRLSGTLIRNGALQIAEELEQLTKRKDYMAQIATVDGALDKVCSRFPRDKYEHTKSPRLRPEEVVQNLVKNLPYLDGSKRAVQMLFADRKNDIEKSVNWVYSRQVEGFKARAIKKDELLHEVYLLFYSRLDRYDGTSDVGKFAFLLAREAARRLTLFPPPVETPPYATSSEEFPTSHTVRRLTLFEIIDALIEFRVFKPIFKQFLVDKYINGLTSEEIAEKYRDKWEGKSELTDNVVDNSLTRLKNIMKICLALDTKTGQEADELSKKTKISQKSVTEALNRLRTAGLAFDKDGEWHLRNLGK